jgi:hypothetical protein
VLNALGLVDEEGHALQLETWAVRWSPRVQEVDVIGREPAVKDERVLKIGLSGPGAVPRPISACRSAVTVDDESADERAG